MSPALLRLDAARANEVLSAVDVPSHRSLAVRAATLAQRTIEAEAELVRLRALLAELQRHREDPDAQLLAELLREARP